MTTVAIRERELAVRGERFRASTADVSADGSTAGQALDALLSQTGAGQTAVPTAVLIARFGPDAFFTQAQQDRLTELLARKSSLTLNERAELEALIDAELDATIARTDVLVSPTAP